MVASTSLARRRLRLSQAMVRSTTQRRGRRMKPLAASERLTISMVQLPRRFVRPLQLVAGIACIGKGRDERVNQQAASETQNESLGRAHDEAPKLLTIARLILKQQ